MGPYDIICDLRYSYSADSIFEIEPQWAMNTEQRPHQFEFQIKCFLLLDDYDDGYSTLIKQIVNISIPVYIYYKWVSHSYPQSSPQMGFDIIVKTL